MLGEHGARFVKRCFTAGERAYAESARRRRAERYAARFACKEAVFKALGTGWRSGLTGQDIEVERTELGQPRLILRGRCAQLAGEMGITHWQVSLSHTQTNALASVIGSG